MGGVVSAGQDNDDLIDNLKEIEYIKTAKVEQVFRIVDRAHYYLPASRKDAYKDLAWKSGTLHLSAPCIYSEVMEALDLQEGLSFLNIGSGTGYLNTMVGFMIGPYGINHGIELHTENVAYAEERLKEFKSKSKKFNDLEFCDPLFVEGNCLHLAPHNRRYDRVYCGAACPPDLKKFIQNLIKIGGILVMPVGDQLLKVKRQTETDYTAENVLPVSFAPLYVPPKTGQLDSIFMPDVNPVSLQNQCATVVRNSIRKNFCFDNPAPKNAASKSPKKTHDSKSNEEDKLRFPIRFVTASVRPQPLTMMMRMYGDSDSDNFDMDDQPDEAFLDLQLQRYAAERQRIARNRTDTDDVDSSLSDEDMNEMEHERSSQHDSGSKTRGNSLKLVRDNLLESMDSEDGVVADDEGGDEDDELEDYSKNMTYGVNRKREGRKGENSLSDVDEGLGKDDQVVNGKGKDNAISKPSSSISSEEEEDQEQNKAKAKESSSGPIQVMNISNPRQYKTSYSTEASETSGFGSLGDDPFTMGSFHSNGMLHDHENVGIKSWFETDKNKESQNREKSFSSAKKNPAIEHSILPSCSHTIEEEDMEDNDNDFKKISDVDSDDEDRSSTDRKEESESLDEHDEEEDNKEESMFVLSEPRGPDFTAFLKVQVETLPIPNTIKQFILQYR